jgi:hypothetical protein
VTYKDMSHNIYYGKYLRLSDTSSSALLLVPHKHRAKENRDALYGDDVISYPTPMCAQQ